MKHGLSVLASPDSPLAPSGGQNGGGTPQAAADPRAVLRAMVAQREDAPAPETNASQPATAEVAPEEAPATVTAEAEAGETDLTSPETPTQEEAEPTEVAEEESGDGQEEAPEETAAQTPGEWAKLSPKERESALELAKQFKPGEIPRIAKLVAQKHQAEQTIEALHKQVEELQQQAEAAGATGTAGASQQPLPEPVAKLKTVQEVQARLDKVSADVEALTDFLDARPGDPETEYQIGAETFTRQQLIDRRAALRAEAKALPKRGEQIVQTHQFAEARKEASRKVLAEYPVLSDPEHPDTKVARQLAKLPQFANEVNGEYLAYVFAVGERTVKAEAERRKAGAPKAGSAKPKGSVPLGKPHSAGGAGAAKTVAGSAAAAMARHAKEKSSGSFAAVLSATGR